MASLNQFVGDLKDRVDAPMLQQLGMRIACRIGAVAGRARLSHEKLYDLLAGQFIKAPEMAAIFDFEPYPDHVIRHKRRRQSPRGIRDPGLNLTRMRMGLEKRNPRGKRGVKLETGDLR
jgi:hypothetical protein